MTILDQEEVAVAYPTPAVGIHRRRCGHTAASDELASLRVDGTQVARHARGPRRAGAPAAHGWQKLTEMGPANFGNNMLGGLGVPAPVLFGNVVTYAELIGGVLLIVGLGTRIVALVLTLILAAATVMVKTDLGLIAPMGAPLPGAELDLALIAGLVGLLLLGPGRVSADYAIGIEVDPISSHPQPVASAG